MDVESDFLSYLEAEQRCSPHTVEAYGLDVRRFIEWITPAGQQFDPRSVTMSDIRAWIASLADQGMVATTLRRKTQSLRAFFRWGMKQGLFSANPAADVSLAKKRKHLPDFVRTDEIESLLNDSVPHSPAEHRAHLAVSMLYSLGLRQAELLSITDFDIDFSSLELRVTGKRNKQRVIPIPSQLAQEIRQWQTIRDQRYPDLPYPRPLIAGPHGAIAKETLYQIIKDQLKATGVAKKSPHTLRHTFATVMVNSGADLDAVREMLGHASLSTTQIYTHLSFNDLLQNYRNSHPRSFHRNNSDDDTILDD
ncbi:MAG: tyrosine-type recombinase/integrase [Lepagella sp.]